jgi:hypothetical protein
MHSGRPKRPRAGRRGRRGRRRRREEGQGQESQGQEQGPAAAAQQAGERGGPSCLRLARELQARGARAGTAHSSTGPRRWGRSPSRCRCTGMFPSSPCTPRWERWPPTRHHPRKPRRRREAEANAAEVAAAAGLPPAKGQLAPTHLHTSPMHALLPAAVDSKHDLKYP